MFSNGVAFARYGRSRAWERVQQVTNWRAGWGDAYGYALLATGRAELMLDAIVSPWDCGPFPPILQEAGGYFGDWEGQHTIYSRQAMATTETLLPEVRAVLREE